MSLVEVSPSTVTRLKVLGRSPAERPCSISREMAQSVVMKHEHGAHVGVDHAGALGDGTRCVTVFAAAVTADGELLLLRCRW